MKFLLIVALAVIGLAFNPVACDEFSSEEMISAESAQIELPPTVFDQENSLNEFIYRPPPPHYIGQHNNMCQTCSMVVTYVSHYGGSSVYSRNVALQTACAHVGTSDLFTCQHFVQMYGSQISHYLNPHSNAFSICHMVHVC